MTVYAPEEFTAEESEVLRRYFTNLDGPVFALVNLPEVVKGALFARYSRTHKSLRRHLGHQRYLIRQQIHPRTVAPTKVCVACS